MSDNYQHVVINAPHVAATQPTVVPALASGVSSGVITDDHLSEINKWSMGAQITAQLRQLPDYAQTAYYNSHLTPTQQDAARFAGYTLPGENDASASKPFDWTPTSVGDVFGDVGTATSNVIGAGGGLVHGIGEALTYPINKVKAGYRQAQTYGWAGGSGWSPAYLSFAPVVGGVIDNAIHDNATEDGDTYYDPKRLGAAKKTANDEYQWSLAKQVADGKSLESIFSEIGDDPTKVTATLAITETQQFHDLVDQINAAHVSPGRDLASMLGLQPGDTGYGTVSGLEDGTFSVLADPLMAIGPVSKGVQVARYGLTTPARAAEIFDKTNVQREISRFAENMQALNNAEDPAAKAAAYANIQANHRWSAPMLQNMVDAGVSSADETKDFLTSAAGFGEIMKGNAAVKVPLMPYRTWVGARAQDLMGAGRNTLLKGPKIDAAAVMTGEDPNAVEAVQAIVSSRNSIQGRALTMMSRPFQKVPFGEKIYLTDDNAHQEIYKLARYMMPRWWANQTSVAFMSADVNGKRQIVKGLMDTMFEVSGVKATAAGRDFANRYLNQSLHGVEESERYAPAIRNAGYKGEDATPGVLKELEPDVLSNGQRAAVYENQLREYASIPNFQDFYKHMVQVPMMEQVQRGRLGNLTGRIITNNAFDKFTQQLWKPGVLLRPALPVRNGMEEIANYIMRHSASSYAKGFAGKWQAQASQDAIHAKVIAKTLGDDAMEAVRKGDYTSLFTGWEKRKMQIHRAKAGLGHLVLSPAEEQYMRDFMEHGGWQSVVHDIEESTDMRFNTSNEKIAQSFKAADRDGSTRFQVRSTSGPFEEASTAGAKGATKWAMYATSAAHSRDGRIALENLHDREAAIEKLIEWVEGSDGRYVRKSSNLFNDVGADEWASRVYDTTKATFSNRSGDTIDEMVAQALGKGRTVDARWIDENLPVEHRPEFTVGQDYNLEAIPDNIGAMYHNAVNKGFEWSERSVGAMSRYPTFMPQYLRHRTNFAAYEKDLASRVGEKAALKEVHNKSYEAAMRDMLEYVDNPAVRSQFAIVMRNIFPFWRAQEEFYVRWAKTGVFNPYAFRKLQLTYQGFREVGFIQTDDQGVDYFTYPLSGEAGRLVTKAASKLGIDCYIPVQQNLRGRITYLNQGLDPNNILPSFGPGPAFLMSSLRTLYPQTAPLERLLLGEQGAGRSPWQTVEPTFIRRVTDSASKASAVMSAMAYMEYAGLSPGDDATPDEIQKYKERLGRWAQAMVIFRAFFGSAAPASPEAMDIAPDSTGEWQQQGFKSVSDEFWALVSSTGNYENALGAWMKVHPDMMPFTVAKTTTPSGAVVPASTGTGDFIHSNRGFFEKYPSAAPFWLVSTQGKFDPDTWDTEMSLGLKDRKTFEDYYTDLKAGPGIEQYYNAKDAHEAYQAQAVAAGDSAGADAENVQYSAWKDGFLAQNPLVQDYVSAGTVRARERENTITQLSNALRDPSVPDTGMTVSAQLMVNAYNAHKTYQNQVTGLDDASVQARQTETTQYDAYMQSLAAQDTGANMMYNSLFRYAS